MKKRDDILPLRLILTGKCNGKCSFCHKEGNENSQEMPIQMIYNCIESAKKLSISKISLTGGEPTLRSDLGIIIAFIQEKGNVDLGITTNGYKLMDVIDSLEKPLDKLNLSMCSLKDELAKRYQNVNPQTAIKALCEFPAVNKTINLVITKDNYTEVYDFIELSREKEVSLNIMFEDVKDSEYKIIQKNVINELSKKYSERAIVLGITPVLSIKLDDKCNIRVKHPYFSKLFHNGICEGCEQYDSCFEKVCAIRVHPDGVVTPCLSKEICVSGQSMFEKIKNAYNNLEQLVFDSHVFD